MRSPSLPSTTRYRLLTCLFLLVALLMAGAGVFPAAAQQPDSVEAEAPVYRVETTKGTVLVGTLVSESEKQIVIDSEQLNEVTVARTNIESMTQIEVVPSSARKSPGRALLYSLAPTFVPLVGWVAGPSVGHFYADANRQAFLGIGIRGAGLLVAAGGFSSSNGNQTNPEDAVSNLLQRGGAIVLGGVIIVVSGLFDIVTAPGSARDYNERHAFRTHVTPTVGPGGNQAGLALHVSF